METRGFHQEAKRVQATPFIAEEVEVLGGEPRENLAGAHEDYLRAIGDMLLRTDSTDRMTAS